MIGINDMAVLMSQRTHTGLIMRAYVEMYNEPKVLNLFSIFSPQEGITQCTTLIPEKMCSVVRESMLVLSICNHPFTAHHRRHVPLALPQQPHHNFMPLHTHVPPTGTMP